MGPLKAAELSQDAKVRIDGDASLGPLFLGQGGSMSGSPSSTLAAVLLGYFPMRKAVPEQLKVSLP